MTTDIQLTPEQAQVITQKREAWAQMGEAVYRQEISLQLRAQQALSDIVLPSTIEEVPEAESRLKEIKAAATAISNDRKAITTKFDDVTARLMQPEKSFAEPVKQLSDAIISVKKTYEASQSETRAKQQELASCEGHWQREQIRVKADCDRLVNELVDRAYTHALNTDVRPEAILEYKDKCFGSVTAARFEIKEQPFIPTKITSEESLQVWKKYFPIDVSPYVQSFRDGLAAKLSDYPVAFANKEQALKIQQDEAKATADALALKQQQSELASKMQQAAQPVSVEPVITKALKKSYEVDMPDSVESILQVMAAFSANIHLCMPKLKVTKWWSFTPLQAANALGKVKSDNNSFEVTGITFKEVDKL